jgi:diguanylate cyclase (GGDEF)-like protein
MAMDYQELLKRLGDSGVAPEILERIRNPGHDVCDSLTGLFDRRTFMRHLAKRLEPSGTPFSLIAVSIDFLNELNLIGGWIIGDFALCGMAAILEAESTPDDLIGRMSGDLFVMLIREHRLPQVRAKMRRIADAVAALDIPGADALPSGHLTLSTGVFCHRVGKVTPEQSIDETRRRLDAARRQGGNRIAVIPENHVVAAAQRQRIGAWISGSSPNAREESRLLELSMNGIAVACRTPWLVRQAVSVELGIGSTVRFRSKGEIVWRKPAERREDALPFAVGIRFANPDSESIDALETLISGDDETS